MTETCIGCEERPARTEGDQVSWLEAMSDRLLYCAECAAACEAGVWEGDEDE